MKKKREKVRDCCLTMMMTREREAFYVWFETYGRLISCKFKKSNLPSLPFMCTSKLIKIFRLLTYKMRRDAIFYVKRTKTSYCIQKKDALHSADGNFILFLVSQQSIFFSNGCLENYIYKDTSGYASLSPLHGALENRILLFFGTFGPFFAHFYPLTICDKSLQ